MATVEVENIGTDYAQVIVSDLPESETGTKVRIYVRTGTIADKTGTKVYDKAPTVYGTHTTADLYDLEPESWYTANASLDGGTTWIGAVEFQTDPEEIDRPDPWGWWYIKKAGAEAAFSASEWNDFTSAINEVRAYRGLEPYNFTEVSWGDTVRAWYIQQVYYAILPMDDEGCLPDWPAQAGDPISVSYLNALVDALNAVE